MFCVCFVFFVTLNLVNGVPTHYVEPLFLSSENVNQNSVSADSNNAVQMSETGLMDDRNSLNIRIPNYHDVMRISDSEVNIIFDTPVYTSRIRDGIEGVSEMDYDLFNQYQLPVSPDLNAIPQVSNQVYDEEPIKISMDIGMSNYDDDDNELPNPVLPLDSLSTYAQRDIPILNTYISYDADVANPENTEEQLPNVRPNRSEDDEYQRFMAELKHDAMMNNILPTINYIRGADEYENEQPVLQGAVFPTNPGDCGLPILLGCESNISKGVLTDSYPQHFVSVS